MNGKLKVLLISPYGDQLDGGIAQWTKHIINYYSGCADENVDMKLLYNPKMTDSYGGDSIWSRLYKGIVNYYPLYRGFKKKTRKEYFDVVHICTSASISLIKDIAIVKCARRRGMVTVVHCHLGRIPSILKETGIEHRLFVKLMKVVDRIVVMDMQSYHALKEYGYNKVSYLPNPLSASVEQLIDANRNINRIPRKIVYAGHLLRGKGVYELVEACKQIKGIRLEMMGHIVDDNIKLQLIELSGDIEGEWLHIRGAQPFEEVIKEMLSCNIFVLPSYSEGFPNVIIESMACGCSIVTTPVGAIPEMLAIDSKNPCGICVEPRNVEQLKNAIVRLLDNPTLAMLYGKKAQERVNQLYSMSKVWGQMVTIWMLTAK